MTSTPLAPAPNDYIEFSGDTVKTYRTEVDRIVDENFKEVRVTGSRSIYYVYPDYDQCGSSKPSNVQIVTSTSYVPLQIQPPKSAKGFSKQGVILFETFNFGGESQNFVGSGSVTDVFPVGSNKGVSSYNVIDGTWQFLTINGGIIKLRNGKTEAGPGDSDDMPFPSDKVASIKMV